LAAALVRLLRDHDHAQEPGHDVWDYAVPLRELRRLGLEDNDLRWLADMQYVRHAVETTRKGEARRRFGPVGQSLFSSKSACVLTESGADLARLVASLSGQPGLAAAVVPSYDVDRGILWVGSIEVLRLKQPAPLLRLILTTFQELNWSGRIDNPISPQPGKGYKANQNRLYQALHRLTTSQEPWLIHYFADGTGEGICWELRWPGAKGATR
jgi:hypothetical protein